VFENVTNDPIPFHVPKWSSDSADSNGGVAKPGTDLSVELAGQWSFYADFRREHALTHLPHPEPPEIALQVGTTLVIPLWVKNATGSPQEFSLAADLPAGWTVQSGAGKFSVGAKQTAATRVEINLPADVAKKNELQEVTVRAESGGHSIGTVKLRVELRKRSLPE
jgi:hypothetical protein